MRHKFRLFLAVVGALAAVAVAAPAGAMAATPPVPWTDPNAKGYIGFCDASDHQIYTGSTESYPFVAKAVSSTPAPKGYGAMVGRAVLYAYQPLQNIDPGDWSGKQMTGATIFSSTTTPMALGLPADPALINFAAAFPLHWEGFAQLRMTYTAPATLAYTAPYPSVAVVVSGTTWTQVGGGPVNCGGGQAESDEADLAIAHNIQRQGGAAKASGNPVETATPTTPASSLRSSGSSSTVPTAVNASVSPVADAQSSSGGSGKGIAIGIVAGVLVIAGGGIYFLRNRRRELEE
jgi:hypothetical protein